MAAVIAPSGLVSDADAIAHQNGGEDRSRGDEHQALVDPERNEARSATAE